MKLTMYDPEKGSVIENLEGFLGFFIEGNRGKKCVPLVPNLYTVLYTHCLSGKCTRVDGGPVPEGYCSWTMGD